MIVLNDTPASLRFLELFWAECERQKVNRPPENGIITTKKKRAVTATRQAQSLKNKVASCTKILA